MVEGGTRLRFQQDEALPDAGGQDHTHAHQQERNIAHQAAEVQIQRRRNLYLIHQKILCNHPHPHLLRSRKKLREVGVEAAVEVLAEVGVQDLRNNKKKKETRKKKKKTSSKTILDAFHYCQGKELRAGTRIHEYEYKKKNKNKNKNTSTLITPLQVCVA